MYEYVPEKLHLILANPHRDFMHLVSWAKNVQGKACKGRFSCVWTSLCVLESYCGANQIFTTATNPLDQMFPAL